MRSMTRLAPALAIAALATAGSLAGPTATASAVMSIDQLNLLESDHRAIRDPICSEPREVEFRGRREYQLQAYYSVAERGKHPHDGRRFERHPKPLRLRGTYSWRACLHRNKAKIYTVATRITNVRTHGRASISITVRPRADLNYNWGAILK
jgi:hypothetical protein